MGGCIACKVARERMGRAAPGNFSHSSLRMNYHVGEGALRKPSMKRILIIEDDKDIVELVRYNLEKEGFRVTAADDGATGLAQAKHSPPDLLVLDLMLPRLPGL